MVNPRVAKARDGVEFFTPERCWILESWTSADDPAVSIALARVEVGVLTQLHHLRGVDERYVIVAGIGEVLVGSARERVEPGDVVAILKGTPQQIRNTGDTDLVFYCVCSPRFTPDCYENLEPADQATSDLRSVMGRMGYADISLVSAHHR